MASIRKLKKYVKEKYPNFFARMKKIVSRFAPLRLTLTFGYFGFDRMGIVLGSYLRKCPFFPSKKYGFIKTLKNKHKGERCFIIATGPSLKIEDINMLKNELTISMNSISKCFGQTDWRPDYYMIQDTVVFQSLGAEIGWKNDKTIKMCSHLIEKFCEKPGDMHVFPVDTLGNIAKARVSNFKFSEDCYLRIFDGNTITYSAIQMAAYMGCDEIYLLGVDCNYQLPVTHAFGYENTAGKDIHDKKDEIYRLEERMIGAYKEAFRYAEKRGIKIYNATRGGMLEVFPRVNFDDLF